MTRRRLGWLGPTVFGVGVAVAALGIWYFVTARPKAGDVIDTFDLGGGRSLVVRAEQGGSRSFVELRAGDDVKWQALIPHYAGSRGRPALAWCDSVVSVRVERDGRAEVFGLSLENSAKVGAFRLATEHEPITTQPGSPITLTDHIRSYEIVGGSDWHQAIAVDLRTGKGLWKVDLGPPPITGGGVDRNILWLEQAGRRRSFDVATGREEFVEQTSNSP